LPPKRFELVKFIPLGGAGEVGRSSYLIDWGKSIIFDAGLDMDNKKLPIFDRISSDVLAIAISHPHSDHVGSLPILWNKVKTTIISTEVTKILSLFMLRRIYRRYGDYLSTIREMEDSWVVIDNNSSLTLNGYTTIELHDAAHTFGSSQILVDVDGYRLLYTGDLYTGESLFGTFYGWEDLNIDDVILEGTEITQNDIFDSEMARMISDLAEKTDEGYLSLIPVNSVGHGPEIMYFISKAVEKGIIGTKNLYSIGTINRVIRLLHENGMYKEVTEVIMRNFKMLEDYRDALEIAKNTRPAILVSTPGKPIGGFSGNLISAVNGDDKTIAMLVEHKALNSVMNAKVNMVKYSLRKHYKIQAIVDEISKCSGIKHIIIVHGWRELQDEIKRILRQSFKDKIILSSRMNKMFEIDPNSTKFRIIDIPINGDNEFPRYAYCEWNVEDLVGERALSFILDLKDKRLKSELLREAAIRNLSKVASVIKYRVRDGRISAVIRIDDSSIDGADNIVELKYDLSIVKRILDAFNLISDSLKAVDSSIDIPPPNVKIDWIDEWRLENYRYKIEGSTIRISPLFDCSNEGVLEIVLNYILSRISGDSSS